MRVFTKQQVKTNNSQYHSAVHVFDAFDTVAVLGIWAIWTPQLLQAALPIASAELPPPRKSTGESSKSLRPDIKKTPKPLEPKPTIRDTNHLP